MGKGGKERERYREEREKGGEIEELGREREQERGIERGRERSENGGGGGNLDTL